MQEKINQCIKDLVKNGKPMFSGTWQASKAYENEKMRLLRNVVLELDLPKDHKELQSSVKADQPWAFEHFKERISGIPTNPGESYKIWPYNTFSEDNDPYMDGKKFSHTYQERFWPNQAGDRRVLSQYQKQPPKYNIKTKENKGIRYKLGNFDDIIKQLDENPYTRQAYLPIFFPEDTGAEVRHKQRVPCTLGYYFWIDDVTQEIHCNYIIRSCDALRHFRNDIYLSAMLLYKIQMELEFKSNKVMNIGTLNMFIFNFHVFENNVFTLVKKEKSLNNLIV